MDPQKKADAGNAGGKAKQEESKRVLCLLCRASVSVISSSNLLHHLINRHPQNKHFTELHGKAEKSKSAASYKYYAVASLFAVECDPPRCLVFVESDDESSRVKERCNVPLLRYRSTNWCR